MKAFLYCKGVIRTRSKAETVRSYFVEALARATRHELRTSPCLTAHLAAFDCFAPLARRFLRQIFVKMTQLYKRIARKMSKKMPKRFRQRRGSYCSLTVYGVGLQFKMDIRSKTMLVTCYLVPLVFFFFMSGIFTSIDPTAKETLIPSMSVFVVTMSALIGLPPALGEVYGGEVKKVYRANGVPLSLGVITQFISSFIHTMIVCLIVFAVAPFAFGAELPSNLPLYFCSLAVLLCATLAIGCIIGLSVRTQAKQTMVGDHVPVRNAARMDAVFRLYLPRNRRLSGDDGVCSVADSRTARRVCAVLRRFRASAEQDGAELTSRRIAAAYSAARYS